MVKVAVISLGGTISGSGVSGGTAKTKLDADKLLAAIPQASGVAEIEAIPFRMVSSSEISYSDLLELRDLVEELFASGTDGVIVTQGTDTIEETSFFLNCTVRSEKPLVVTGAMRNPTLAGPDGPANLLSSIRLAASGKTTGLGTVVVMNDIIHHSKYVTKGHTSNPNAFTSFPLGPIGWIAEDMPRIAMKPLSQRLVLSIDAGSPEKDIGFYTVLLGDTGRMIRHLPEMGYDGLIVEATGGGHVIPSMADQLVSIASRIPTVLASRTRHGEILTKTYSFKGSEKDLLERGLIPGRAMNSIKARILLYLLMRAELSMDEIRKTFREWL